MFTDPQLSQFAKHFSHSDVARLRPNVFMHLSHFAAPIVSHSKQF